MEYIRTSKEIVKEWVEKNMTTHSDWTGTRVETKFKCESIDEFVEKLYEYLEESYL
jgi:DNA topoisomerase VI subunit B